MRRKDREVTQRAGIEAILKRCKTCHVAMTQGDMPYVVPLSFGYAFLEDGLLALYFHSAPEGKKLDILKANNKVCFELSCEGELLDTENPCNAGYYFSSVIGFGTAVFLEEEAEKCRALSLMFRHQTGREVSFNSQKAKTVCVFKIVSSDFTGKQKPKPQ